MSSPWTIEPTGDPLYSWEVLYDGKPMRAWGYAFDRTFMFRQDAETWLSAHGDIRQARIEQKKAEAV